MGQVTGISWCDSTFNTWSGCSKCSTGCANCFAEALSGQNPAVLGKWGPNGTRVARVESYMNAPLRWDRKAAKSGKPHRVFAHSDSDWCEQWDGPIINHLGQSGWVCPDCQRHWYPVGTEPWNHGVRPLTMDDLRLDLFRLIQSTPNLDWLLLTKRIEHVVPTLKRCMDLMDDQDAEDQRHSLWMWLDDWVNCGYPPANVWLGTSVENQATADERIPHLLKTPAAVRWVSAEPLLGPVDFGDWLKLPWMPDHIVKPGSVPVEYMEVRGLNWIVCGGESGRNARPFDLAWARSIRDQCEAAGVAFYFKQAGAEPYDSSRRISIDGPGSHALTCDFDHKAGADPAEWPEDLRRQQFPR